MADASIAEDKREILYQRGSSGVGVELVQTILKSKEYYKGEINGEFDETTEDAVRSFQEKNNLASDGFVDAKTQEQLIASWENGAYSFEQVLERELIEISLSREKRFKNDQVLPRGKNVLARVHGSRLLGLALSGGGIRSATFNLGVLQAMAELKLLRRIDYLSTVSGGGYIGSWLAAWIKREKSVLKVEQDLSQKMPDDALSEESKSLRLSESRESKSVRFLRSYSNYITPKKGLFSSDTWSVVSTYLRNLTLNLIIIVSAFITLLLIPRLFVWAANNYGFSYTHLLIAAGVLLLVSLGFIALNLGALLQNVSTEWRNGDYRKPGWIRIMVVCPVVIAALSLSYFLWCVPEVLNKGWWTWAIKGMAAYSCLWLLAWGVGRFLELIIFAPKKESEAKRGNDSSDQESRLGNHSAESQKESSTRMIISIVLFAPLVGVAGGLLFRLLGFLLQSGLNSNLPAKQLSQLVSWGPPSMIMLFSLIVTLHIGLMGRAYPEKMQEWWSRLGGFLMIVALAWAVWFGIAIYGPVVLEWQGIKGWVKGAIASGWLLATVAGLLAGKSPLTGGTASKREFEFLAKAAPHMFVIGLFLLLSNITAVTLNRLIAVNFETSAVSSLNVLDATSRYFSLMEWWHRSNLLLLLVICILVCIGVTVVFGWRVDINQFSMHLLYRNRLASCFLGASAKRTPHPFTGFDSRDDFPMHELAAVRPDGTHYDGPYLIVNAALNLVTGQQLAWQERKAASFVFTPQFCGYELPTAEDARESGGMERDSDTKRGYRSTARYAAKGGISLGTAMSISGAAACPNMGYHSSPALAFLMTVFNVRLGWWLGNTLYGKKKDAELAGSSNPGLIGKIQKRFPDVFTEPWKKSGPIFGLSCLLAELFGFASNKSRFIYLSDGGHFDNLGIYELVRRRCRYIIACDASQDGGCSFDDLGRTIRRCYADFGIEIVINVEPIKPQEGKIFSQWHCAVGEIHYEKVDRDAVQGTLVYLKPSFTGDEPTDLFSYRACEPEFPHERTVDQWFDESQFESYRKLGHHIAMTTFQAPLAAVVEMRKTAHAVLVQLEESSVSGELTTLPAPTPIPLEEALFTLLHKHWCYQSLPSQAALLDQPPMHAKQSQREENGTQQDKVPNLPQKIEAE